MKSPSSRVYVDTSLSYTELLQSLEAAQVGKVQTVSIQSSSTMPNIVESPKVTLVLLDAAKLEDNLGLMETVESKRGPNAVSVLLGYGKAKPEPRLLQEVTNQTTTSNDKVNATATGGLMISLLVTLIAVFGLVMMANIQTPKTFVKKNLIKGRINRE